MLQHGNRVRSVTTTCCRLTSARIRARPVASHFNQHATPELQHDDQAGPVTTTCHTSTSTAITVPPVARHFASRTTPEFAMPNTAMVPTGASNQLDLDLATKEGCRTLQGAQGHVARWVQ